MEKPRQFRNARLLHAYVIAEGVPHSEPLAALLAAHSCEVVMLESAQQALEILATTEADLIVLDNATPGGGCVGVIHHLRDIRAISPSVPVLAIARPGLAESDRVALQREGIWDVIAQPWNSSDLNARLSNFLAARRAFLDAQDNSLLDATTGLYSRKGLDTRVTELAGQCARQGALLSCVAFTLATSSGEPKGIRLETEQLADIGDELRRVGRASDTIGRSNNGEFVVLAPGVSGGNARLIANRLTRSVTARLQTHGIDCDAPWVGRVLQPSHNGERLGEELLSDTLLALQEVTAEHEIPASL